MQFVLKTDYPVRYASGRILYSHKAVPTIKFLLNLMVKEFPHLEGNISERQLQRVLDRQIRKEPGLFILAMTIFEHYLVISGARRTAAIVPYTPTRIPCIVPYKTTSRFWPINLLF